MTSTENRIRVGKRDSNRRAHHTDNVVMPEIEGDAGRGRDAG
jgi:hypothetical protein